MASSREQSVAAAIPTPVPPARAQAGSAKQVVAGRYELEERLGSGGMGSVYRARDLGSDRMVALKLLHSQAPRHLQLFQREFKTLANLRHPGVVEVYEHGIAETGKLYYTMELLGGRDLMVASPLPWRRVCSVIRDVATPLALLHAQRLVHRDVNPRNVRLAQSGAAKLLDFGALTDFGVPLERVGTPICIAPEAFAGRPLEARTDLFSLGVVAYWSLTGRLPYAVQSFADAEQAWQKMPVAPSRYVPNLPAGLDDVLLSMLSVDPLGRPASAAEVIDRIGAIAGLEEEPLWNIAESHVASCALIAREREQAKFAELLADAAAGQGTVLSLVGESGSGKTRLLRELSIEAQLRGFAAIQLDARRLCAPEELLVALARGLLEQSPREARASSLLGDPGVFELLAELGVEAGSARPRASERDHDEQERMLRLCSRTAQLAADVAGQRAVLITIDDADALAPSAARLLPMLAEKALGRTLLVAAARASGAVSPSQEERAGAGEVIRIGPFDARAVDELVGLTFGEVPNRARVSRWLSLASRGNPGRLRDALMDLLNRRVVRYGGGAWLLPNDLSDQPLPSTSGPLSDAQLGALSPAARALFECLSVHPGALEEQVCSGLSHGAADAIAELERLQLVLRMGDYVRLLQPEHRATFLSGLTEEQRRATHRRLIETIQKSAGQALSALEVGRVSGLCVSDLVLGASAGLHMLMAGQEQRGTRILRHVAVELTVRGEGLSMAAPVFEEAVSFHRARGASQVHYTALMVALALAGTYADWRLSYRYAEEVLINLSESAGITWARRLAPLLGEKVALFASLAAAFVLYHLVPSRHHGFSFRLVLLGLVGIGAGGISVATVVQDAPRARRLLSLLEPLDYFPALHPARAFYGFMVALCEHAKGNFAGARARAIETLAYARSQEAKRRLPDKPRLQLEAGVLILLGQLDVCRTDHLAVKTIEDIRQLDTSTSRQTYAATLMSYHGNRGERGLYIQWRERTDQLAAEEGSTWRNDVQVPRTLWSTHMMCEDVLTLKRDMEQLRRLATQIPTIVRLSNLVTACYLCERGMAQEALEKYEPAFQLALEESGLRAQQVLGAYARILRKAGRPAEAVAICRRAQSRLRDDERDMPLLLFLTRIELPRSLVALGDFGAARQELDALLAEQASHDNPLLHALTRGACAELALREGASARFLDHAEAMRPAVQKTQHPALFAYYQRVCERASAELLASAPEPFGPAQVATVGETLSFETE